MHSIADLFSKFLTSYSLEAEALLTWFPTRSNASLKEARMRGGTFRHSIKDKDFELGPFGEAVRVVHFLGQGGHEDPLAPDNRVVAFIEIGVNQDGVFETELELAIGPTKRNKRILLQPDTRTPFMINLPAAGGDEIVKDTAAVLQGVFTASPILGLRDLAALSVGRASGP